VKELRGESDPRLNMESMEEKEEPITPILSNAQKNDEPTRKDTMSRVSAPPLVHKITKRHIKKFIHDHKIQVEAVEAYLRSSIELVNDFEHDCEELNKYNSTAADEILSEKYIHYKTELDYKGNRVNYFLDILKNKIKEELADEEE
jgi:hypothetical protein